MNGLTKAQKQEVKELTELTTVAIQATWKSEVQITDGKILIDRLLDLTCIALPELSVKKYVVVIVDRDDHENPIILFQEALDEDIAEHNAIVSLFLHVHELEDARDRAIDEFYSQIEEGVVTYTIKEIIF